MANAYTEVVRLRGSTYVPSPETHVQMSSILGDLADIASKKLFFSKKELKSMHEDEIIRVARRYERIRALAMALKRLGDGRLRAIELELRDNRRE